jgi:hypothetical protein
MMPFLSCTVLEICNIYIFLQQGSHKTGTTISGSVHFKVSYDKKDQTVSVVVVECQVSGEMLSNFV